jgi:hypothetical protein
LNDIADRGARPCRRGGVVTAQHRR